MRLRIKICGLNDAAAVEAACAAGADALGFVLAPSPRRLTLAAARELLRLVPPGIERVAVFARATRAELEQALELGVDALQAEADSDWPPLERGVFALPMLRDGADLAQRAAALRLAPSAGASLRGAFVLDGTRGGGQGELVELARAQELAARHALVLAGGLTPANVAARIRAVRPFAVDVSSGVERVRGQKDPALVHAFVRAARTLETGLSQEEPPR
ncbi:MAG: phosphoribosylanthranilate isomerase [Planctomycetes bacterium]|nr:phosphoribosylanthranilate isomerase [Planctomycetota bacterium]